MDDFSIIAGLHLILACMNGSLIMCIKYNSLLDGNAISINNNAGIVVIVNSNNVL